MKQEGLMRRLKLTDSYGITALAVGIGCMVFVALIIVAVHFAYQHDKAACEAQGGQLVSETSTGFGTVITGNGQVGTGVVTTTNTDCVVPQ